MSSSGGDCESIQDGGDGEPAPTKKPGRGPTTLTRVVNKPDKEVKFDKLGRPIVNSKSKSYSSHLGLLVRAKVSVKYQEWPSVPDHIKKKIWHDIRIAWKLPDDARLQKEVTIRMGVHFRKFRTILHDNYLKKGKTPFKDYSNITPDDWDVFIEYRKTEKFQELSDRGKENQSKNIYKHFLGSRGYSGEKFQKRLKECFKESLSQSSSGSTSDLSEDQIVDLSIEQRHVPWKLAREKVLPDGERVYPDKETKEMFEKIAKHEEAFEQGMLTIDRFDDILGNSLPNREHSGRLRGVGSHVGVKKCYNGQGKRKRHTSLESEANIEQRIQREVERRMKPFLEQQEALQRQMTMLMSQQRDMGNTLVSSPTTVQSSCHSVQPPHCLDLIKEGRSCKLHLVRDGQKIEVAVGMVYPSPEGTVIHHRPVPPDHVKVMVDDYVPGESDTPVPVPNGEVETLRSARYSFTAWPKDMVSLDEESHNELQVPTFGKSFHSDVFAPKQYKGFDGLNFDKLGPVFKNLRDRFLKKVENKFTIDLPLDLFHSKDSIVFHADDLKDLMTPKAWLPTPIIQIFMLYAHKYYKDEYPNELVGFMDPAKTCYTFLNDAKHREFADKYISRALKENRDKKIIFIPYHQIDHWVLVVLNGRESTLYLFDSDQKNKKKLMIIEALRDAYRVDRCYGGPGKNANLKVIDCKCPQQLDSWECGYYVMLFMHDIITRFLDIFPKLKEFPTSYNEINIDYIQLLWGKFLLKEVLVE